jgi:hypothetical protein
MLRANGIAPTESENKCAADHLEEEDVKPGIIDIKDDADEISTLEVSF